MDVVIDAALSGHKDLKFSIPSVGVNMFADTYYIRLALNDDGIAINHTNITTAVASLLKYWFDQVNSCEVGDVIHLPFGFWDEGIGYLKIKFSDDGLRIIHGYTTTGGWAVNPLRLGDFCHDVKEFQTLGNEKQVAKHSFLDEIDDSVGKLDKSARK